MAITFSCEGCGKSYTLREEFAGKTAKCKRCGRETVIPFESDSGGYGVDLSEAEPGPESAPLPPRSAMSAPQSSSARRPLFDPPEMSAPARKGFFSLGSNEGRGVVGGMIFLALFGFRIYNRWERNQARNERNAQANVAAPFGGNVQASSPDPSAPIALPNFPEPGPGREVEFGVTFHEIVLGPPDPVPGQPPGHCGKLWLYLPSGDRAPKSLPGILIAGAGATLHSGMKLGNGDIPEHLPYVRAGFAVMAYEVDGMLENRENPGVEEIRVAATRFQAARAGLVNAHIALEYLLARVPAVDPARLTAAGHSSAGTLALLFAEHEPRLRSCVAFAPVDDIAAQLRRFGRAALMQALIAEGFGDLFTRYAPRTHEARLERPLFLFHALDDLSAPDITAFGNRLKSAGRPVTVSTVPSGGHYDAMINEGVPQAISWLRENERAGGGQ